MRVRNSLFLIVILFGVVLQSCAGWEKGCSSGCASSLGADWIIVQYTMSGEPFRCWALENVSVDNEAQSDGIYWLTPTRNLVHISGTYNRVQVVGNRWDEGYAEVGLTEAGCSAIHSRVFNVGEGYQ